MTVNKCTECGFNYSLDHAPDKTYHRKVHDKAVNGSRTKLPDGFHSVTHQSPIAIQRSAQEAASEARRETGYDFTSFYGVKKRFDEHNTIAVICVMSGRVVGLVVSRERECTFRAELNSFREDDFGSWVLRAAPKLNLTDADL
jgi:zinc-finger of acetyl-transferase ESCO